MLSIGLTDFGFSIYESYSHASKSSVGMAAHIGGAMGGFLVGINVVRNFHAQVFTSMLIHRNIWQVLNEKYHKCIYFFGYNKFCLTGMGRISQACKYTHMVDDCHNLHPCQCLWKILPCN